MAIFPFKCWECAEEWEEDQSLHLDVHESKCPKCGKVVARAYVPLEIYKQFHEGMDIGAGEHFSTQSQKDEFLAREADSPAGLTRLYTRTRGNKKRKIRKNYGHIG